MCERLVITAGILIAASTVTASGQTPDSAALSSSTERVGDEEFRLPVGEELSREIAALVLRLGAPLFAERKAATDRLIEIGAPALAELRGAYRSEPDLEARLRIEHITLTSYLNYYVYDRHGFLGVSLWAYTPGRRIPARVPEDTPAIVVQSVIQGTGAEAAGLKRDDVIIAVDGEPLTGSMGQLVANFAKLIRSHRPGTTMRLTVIRGPKQSEIDATVGRCPKEQIRRGRVTAIPELLHKAETKFPAWWDQHFGRPAVESARNNSP